MDNQETLITKKLVKKFQQYHENKLNKIILNKLLKNEFTILSLQELAQYGNMNYCFIIKNSELEFIYNRFKNEIQDRLVYLINLGLVKNRYYCAIESTNIYIDYLIIEFNDYCQEIYKK